MVRADSLTALGPAPRVRLVWINSPANPTGRVLPAAHLRKMVDWARERGAVVASDECYLSLGWETTPALGARRCCDGDTTRCWRCTRCPSVPTSPVTGPGSSPVTRRWWRELLAVRKHAGMIVPAPVQAAMVAALRRRGPRGRAAGALRRAACQLLRAALVTAGFTIEHSEAGLYLWATRDEDCWPPWTGSPARASWWPRETFYGPAGGRHVRVALTATDERVAAAVARLADG